MTVSQYHMGKEERRQRERAERTKTIVDAAELIILEKGFEAATMDDIAERAELSKGTLYLYFKNKTELYLAVCNRGAEKLNGRFANVLTCELSGLEMLQMMGEVYLDFVENEPVYFRAFAFYEAVQDPVFLRKSSFAKRCEENSRQTLTYMVRALQIGMQDGSIDRSFDPKELAVMIWSSSRGIVQAAHLKSEAPHFKMLDDFDIDMKSMLGAYIRIVSAGMSGKKPE